MKKTVKSILLTLLITSVFNVNAQKLGHIDMQQISLDLPAYSEAEAELQSMTETAQKEIQQYEKLTNEEIEKYKNEMQNLSEDARSRREAFLMERQQNIQKKEYEWQQKIQTTQQELMSNIQSIVIEASKAVAKEEGYLYVFEKGSLVYAGGDNITDKVRKKLGINTSN